MGHKCIVFRADFCEYVHFIRDIGGVSDWWSYCVKKDIRDALISRMDAIYSGCYTDHWVLYMHYLDLVLLQGSQRLSYKLPKHDLKRSYRSSLPDRQYLHDSLRIQRNESFLKHSSNKLLIKVLFHR